MSSTPAAQSIDARQVAPDAARLLRAYSWEYRVAKRYSAARRSVAFALAVAGPITKLVLPIATPWIAAAAGAWLLLGRLVLTPAEDRHVALAVRFQEKFDTLLFDLPWPSSLAGTPPSEEDVAAAAQRLTDDQELDQLIREGWYPATAGLPHPVDVLVAQMASVTWGRRQHASYQRTVLTLAILVLTIGIVVLAASAVTLTDWLVTFLLPAMPALLDAVDLGLAHRDIGTQKREIEERVQTLWDAELAHPGALTQDDCRSVQDETFKLRSQGLQVPQWFYKLNRRRDDATMRDAAEARRQQYGTALKAQANRSPRQADEAPWTA